MNKSDRTHDRGMRRLSYAVMLLAIMALAVIPVAGAVDYEYDVDGKDYTDTDVTFTFSDLEPNAGYKIVGVTESGDTIDKQIGPQETVFSANGQGGARVTVTINPISNNVKYKNTRGWRYQLDGATEPDTPLYVYYGLDYGTLDTFYDNTVQHDLHKACNGNFHSGPLSESNQRLVYTQATAGLNYNLSKDHVVVNTISASDPFDSPTTEFAYGSTLCSDNYGVTQEDYGGGTGGTFTWANYYNETAQAFYTCKWGGGNDLTDCKTSSANLGGGGWYYWTEARNLKHEMFEMAVVPKKSLSMFTAPDIAGSNSTTYYDWGDYYLDATSNPGLAWFDYGGGTATSFFDDLQTSTKLKAVNRFNGTINRLTYGYEALERIELLNRDPFVVASPTTVPINFKMTALGTDGNGAILTPVLFVKKDGAGSFTEVDATLKTEDLGGCDPATNGYNCDPGETVTAALEFEYSDVDGSGQYDYYVNVTQTYVESGTLTSDVFQSNTQGVYLNAGFKDVEVTTPPDGGNVFDDFTVGGTLTTEVPGELRVYLNGSVVYTEVYDSSDIDNTLYDAFSRDLSVNTLGQYNATAVFNGDDGVSTRDTNIFTVVDGNKVNATFNYPTDGATITERDPVYNVTVETDGTYTIELRRDGTAVGAALVDAGTTTLTIQDNDVTPGTHTLTVRAINESTSPATAYDVKTITYTTEAIADLQLDAPTDGQRFSSTPVAFTANLSTNLDGELILIVNKNTVATKDVEAPFFGTATIETEDVKEGYNTYKWQYRITETNADDLETVTRAFYVNDVPSDATAPGGVFGTLLESIRGVFALEWATDLEKSVISLSIIFVVSALLAGVSGLLGIAGFITMLSVASVQGLIPGWIGLAVAVLAAFAVYKSLDGGG